MGWGEWQANPLKPHSNLDQVVNLSKQNIYIQQTFSGCNLTLVGYQILKGLRRGGVGRLGGLNWKF